MAQDPLLDVANEKCANFTLLETTRRALSRRNIKWLLTRLGNHFESKQMCFYSNLGKIFQLPEFRQNYFRSEIKRVVLREKTFRQS